METTNVQRKYRRLLDYEKEAIRAQWRAGARQVDLAKAFGVTQATISRTCSVGKEMAG